MTSKIKEFLRGAVSPFEVLVGSWVALVLLFSVLLGAGAWNVILASLAWFGILAVFLMFKRRSLRPTLDSGPEPPEAGER